MNLEHIKLPEDARNYVTLKLMRANLANHAVQNPKIQAMGKNLFAAMLVNALKKRKASTGNPMIHKHPSALVEKIRKIFKK